jgi:Na+/phosphate symporter
MGSDEPGARNRWPVRGAGFVGGLAAALLTVFVVPAGLSPPVTLGAMAVVGGLTAVQAARQPVPAGAGAVSAGVAAVLLGLGGISSGLQALQSEPTQGQYAGVVQQGAYVLAGVGLVLGLFAAVVSVFFWRWSQRRQNHVE